MIIFLDFDGVLHGYGQPSFQHLPAFEAILRSNPHVEVVFSTSWREHHVLDRLRSFFSEDIRPRLIGVTPFLDVNREPPYVDFVRHKEILLWLGAQQNPRGQEWVALDDDHREFPPNCPELITCNPKQGLGDTEVIEKLKKRLLKMKNGFFIRWKHQYTDASDVEFSCIANDETHVVEITPTPDHLDSSLFLELVLRTLPEHGIDAVAAQRESWGNTTPPWKMLIKLDGILHKIEVVEIMVLGARKEYTVILKAPEKTS